VVTGHYLTVLAMADLKNYGEFVGEFVQAVRDARKAGLTADDFSKAWKVPDRFLRDGYVDTAPYVGAIWNETN